MACLDTTFLIDLSRRGASHRCARARAKLAELAARGETMATACFNVAELYVGVFRARDAAREEAAIRAVLDGLEILEFTDAVARIFGRITAHQQVTGQPGGDMDVLIAATALAANHSIVTRNPSHFDNIPGLSVESY